MSPYSFYQGWMSVEDELVHQRLLQLTFRDVAECREIADAHAEDPGLRLGQRTLAGDLTTLVHGDKAASAAVEASGLLFSGAADPTSASAAALESLAGEVPTTETDSLVGIVVDALVETGLATSKGDARRAIGEGGIYLNGQRVTDVGATYDASGALAGGHHLFRRGKKRYHLLRMRR